MKILATTYFIFLSIYLFGQIEKREFGEITSSEYQMKNYPEDEDAEALILYDAGKSIFFDSKRGYDIRFTRHKLIKIFKKSGDKYGEVSIPYYMSGTGISERIVSIQAVTHQTFESTHTSQKLDPKTIYDEKINDNWRRKIFVFPNVQEGSIVELKYIIESPFHFNLPDWTFQDKIPTLYSAYQVNMIPFFEYSLIAQGINRFDHRTSKLSKVDRSWGSVNMSYNQNVGGGIEFNDMIHTFVLKNVPAFKDESHITSVNDYIKKMNFQMSKINRPSGGSEELMTSWPELNDALLSHKNFGKYIKKAKKFCKKILKSELKIADLSSKETSKNIIQYVKDNFTWNYFDSKYTSQIAKSFYENKRGNSADINLFLLALLREAGIECKPVILSTRNHGKINVDFPFDHFTNYVLVLLESDNKMLVDATEDLLSNDNIPIRCINDLGLVVKKEDKVNWLKIKKNRASTRTCNISIKLNPEESTTKNTVAMSTLGYEAFRDRKTYRNDSTLVKEAFKSNVGTMERVKFIHFERLSKPYTIALAGEKELLRAGENLIVDPFLGLPISENEFTQKKRMHPVDLIYPKDHKFESTIAIPDGYELVELPEDVHNENQLVSFNMLFEKRPKSIKIKGDYSYKKSIYQANEYQRLKAYTEQIVELFQTPIILEKSK